MPGVSQTRRSFKVNALARAAVPMITREPKLCHAFATASWSERDLVGLRRTGRERPLTALSQVRGRSSEWWRVEDSNLGSFRDGFTVRQPQRVDQCELFSRGPLPGICRRSSVEPARTESVGGCRWASELPHSTTDRARASRS